MFLPLFLHMCKNQYHSPYPYHTWVNSDKSIAKQILPDHRTVYFSQLLKTNFLSETSFLGPTGIYLFEFGNINSKIKCKICSGLTIEAPDVVQVFLFFCFQLWIDLTHCFSVFSADLQHANGRWNTLLPWLKFSYGF